MKIIDFFNDRVKRLSIFDIKLVQGAAMAVMLILVKIFPDIMTLSVWWFVALMIAFAPRPMYLFFIKP